MKTLCVWTLVAVAALAACGDNKDNVTVDAATDAAPPNPVARGEYIVNVLGACSFCHTPLLANGQRDLDNLLAGVDCFIDFDSPDFTDNHNGIGCLSTRNLTPHETGLKNATDAAIKNAFQNGMRTDGKKLTPIMPWYIFHNMTDDDANAVVAYLRSVPPVDHMVRANESPAADYNNGAPVWNVTPLLDNQIPMPRGGTNNQAAMHGRYLAAATGLCIDCHTPEVSFGAIQLDTSKAFAGGKVFPKGTLGLIDQAYPAVIATRNLTPDETGLGGWTKDQIKQAIAAGKDLEGKAVCAATHGSGVSPYAGLTDSDLDDIAEYLIALPPIVNDTANDPAAANCGVPPVGTPEAAADCGNNTDDDGDQVPNDGCPVACGNCQGPTVP